jgi:DNA-binding transcriptional MerR regulator/effector-binding domain-containing protein
VTGPGDAGWAAGPSDTGRAGWAGDVGLTSGPSHVGWGGGARISAMRVRLAIGDFSRMTLVSIKALRHYHEIGLLVPAVVDPASGYRFYEPAQVPVAQVIRRFRDLGMPLEEIGEVLQAPDVQVRNQLIAAHLQRMEAQLAATQAVVASLRSLLEGPPAPVAVELRSVGIVPALAIAGQVSMPDLDGWWTAAFGELDAVLAASGRPAAGPRAALYPAELFQLEIAQVTAYIPVAGEVAADGRAAMQEIPAAELAVAVHRGAFSDLDQTYGALGCYVAEREIGVEGPIREQYLVTPFDTDEESRQVTEICWPIFRTTGSSGNTRSA